MRIKRNIENKRLLELLNNLRKAKKPFWKRVRELLSKPRRKRVAVNISKIDKYSKEGETVIVPGKVLGSGNITKPLRIVAFSFSETAKKQIQEAGGKAEYIEKVLEKEQDNVSQFRIII